MVLDKEFYERINMSKVYIHFSRSLIGKMNFRLNLVVLAFGPAVGPNRSGRTKLMTSILRKHQLN